MHKEFRDAQLSTVLEAMHWFTPRNLLRTLAGLKQANNIKRLLFSWQYRGYRLGGRNGRRILNEVEHKPFGGGGRESKKAFTSRDSIIENIFAPFCGVLFRGVRATWTPQEGWVTNSGCGDPELHGYSDS